MNEGVFFHGPIDSKVLLEHLVEMDVLLHPALEESFGMVVAEAMALGIPVVGGTNSGAVPWIVGRDGLLVDVTKPYEICRALLEIGNEPSLRRTLAQSGCRRIRSLFQRQKIAGEYEVLYHKAIEG
jgi:glycosyltransferase involved in cell wall biosynthesis